MSMRVFPAGLVAIGEQVITCSSTAQYPVNSTCRAGAQLVRFSVETNSVRCSWAANSTVPSRTTGVLLVKDQVYEFPFDGSENFKFSSYNSTAGVVNLTTFKYAGAY